MSFVKGNTKEIIKGIVYEVDGVKCDVCGKIIRHPVHPERWFDEKFKFYKVTTHHNDWGNDSIDSFKHFHVCPECITKFVADYLKEDQRTGCIDIETCHMYENMTSSD